MPRKKAVLAQVPAVDLAAAQIDALPDADSGTRLPKVELVAAVRGFYKGVMVEPGKSFMFDPNPRTPGGEVKWPKWAAVRGEKAVKQPVADDKPFDTRPVAAIAAAKRKAGQLGGAA